MKLTQLHHGGRILPKTLHHLGGPSEGGGGLKGHQMVGHVAEHGGRGTGYKRSILDSADQVVIRLPLRRMRSEVINQDVRIQKHRLPSARSARIMMLAPTDPPRIP